jgi:serine phosphatase RsbU (regulator of sigma subunit)/ligand-binding sensor domain-containing protein
LTLKIEYGAGYIDGDKLFQFSEKEGLKENTILDIDESLNGEIFFATYGAHLCSWDGKKFYYWDNEIGIKESIVWCLSKDLKGDLWIGTWGGGVYKWDGNVLRNLVVSDGNLIGSILCMDGDERGNVWLGTYGKGLVRIGADGIDLIDSKRGLVAEKVMDVFTDRYNRVWISTEGNGIQVLNNSPFEHFPTPKGWESSASNHLLVARNNDVWMGSTETGMVLLHENQFTDISSQYQVGNTFYDLIEGKDGKIWIATNGSGMFCVDPNGCIKYNRDSGLCSNVITALFEDSRKRIWMAFDNNKVAYLQNDSLYVINEYSSETRSAIRSFTEDDQGNLYWGVNDMGMVKCSFQNNRPQLMIYSRNEGFKFRSFSDFCFFNGSIWVCSESGVVQWREEKWSLMEKHLGREMGQAFSFQPWNYRLMVWTEKGLIALVQNVDQKNQSIASRKGSLPSYSIQRSAQFEDEHVINNREARMVVDIYSNLLFSSGGVILKIEDSQWEQERIIGKPIVRLTKINGASYQSSLSHRLLITSKDGASQHLTSPIYFEYNENNLAFSFSSGAESILANETYTYQLKGIQNDWSIPSSDREIEFLSLPSGSFELQVAIVFSNGEISPIATLPFTINPPWWLSFWAIGVYLLMAIGCIGLYVRWRMFKLQIDQRNLQQKIDEATKEIVAQKKQAVEQGEQILESQRLMVESIEYAKRIQTAILPPKKLVQSFLPKSFIFYQPKDIVAGDFYWMETIKRMDEEWIAFAVADCTGHGVPGALMSVLCHNGLSRSVMEHGLLYPDEILNKTRDIVIYELGDDENALHDGMDISLCVLSQNRLYWSGANRPLWIVRDHEILEFKGDKQPVGRYHHYSPFSLQKVNLESGDLVFVFTDGYIDQFGGDQGKKFKANQLKKKLIELCDMDSEDIRDNLANTFAEWKGNLEQVDDVCLIGFKF